MKKLLSLLLLLLPFGVTAQETKKWEVGLNTAAVFAKMHDLQSGASRWVMYDYYFLANHMSVSAYHNFSHVQVGMRVEGGLFGGGEWWMSPQAVVNYKIPFHNLYIYGGGVVGYAREQRPEFRYSQIPAGTNGLMTGLQAGTVIFPGKRIGINLETGVRFKHMYRTAIVTDYNSSPQIYTKVIGVTDTYIPISLGVRYRF